MAKIKYSEAAIRDLEGIGNYISETLKSTMAALNTVNKIQDAIDKLADFPLIGAPLSSIVAEETGYRFLVCGNYLAFHHVHENKVHIDRILYGRRNYMAILLGDTAEDDGSQQNK